MAYTNKTQPTTTNPEDYLKKNFPKNERIQEEALILIKLYTKASGSSCVMWNKIFGFGKYHYLDSKGGEHTHLVTGFAVSSTGFTLYNMVGWDAYKKDLKNLGKYKISGKSCLAITSVHAIDQKILTAVIKDSLAVMRKKYQTEK